MNEPSGSALPIAGRVAAEPGTPPDVRHAVQWSYDHLDDAEKALLDRLSVFAGGFELESACAVAGSEHIDDFGRLGSAGCPGAQVTHLVANGPPDNPVLDVGDHPPVRRGAARRGQRCQRGPHGACSLLRLTASPTSLPCGTARDSSRPITGLVTEFANLRTAFRWAADDGDLDAAAAIVMYSGFLGIMVENQEPVTWAEQVVEPARSADHRRLGNPVSDGVTVLCHRANRGLDPLQPGSRAGPRRRPRRGAVRPGGVDNGRTHGRGQLPRAGRLLSRRVGPRCRPRSLH